MRRSRGCVALAVVFGLLALNAFAQVILVPLDRSDDPPLLTVLQALVATVAGAAAWGSWFGTRWAPVAAFLYGLVTAGLLVSLDPLLYLGHDARDGLWVGAALALLFGVWAAWYLQCACARDSAGTPPAPV